MGVSINQEAPGCVVLKTFLRVMSRHKSDIIIILNECGVDSLLMVYICVHSNLFCCITDLQ